MKSKHLILTLGGLLFCSQAMANVGIPVVVYGYPFVVASLLFVILSETFVLSFLKGGLSLSHELKWVGIANLLTTLIGYPLAAIFTALMPFVIRLQIGWLIPFENLAKMEIYHFIALAITLIPCFFLSVWLERWLINRFSKIQLSWKEAYLMHGFSYGLLIGLAYIQWPIKLWDYMAIWKFLNLS
ncbi:MAG: hypothetical protein KDD33_05015 [Bdellovibrionales bacterium]|nr:hypothetical protein [Bdellovibrionales bacterium]